MHRKRLQRMAKMLEGGGASDDIEVNFGYVSVADEGVYFLLPPK